MNLRAFPASLGLAWCLSQAFGPTAQAGNRVLIIGVGDYGKQAKVTPLPYSLNDARRLERIFGRLKGEARFEVTTLTSTAADKGTDREASSENILRQLRRVSLEANDESSILLVTFSGHGKRIDKRNYFLPSDTGRDPRGKLTHMIDIEGQVLEAMKACKARHKILFVDACRDSGEGGMGGSEGELVVPETDSLRKDGVNAIYSCKDEERSMAPPKLGHGVFSYFLSIALLGGDDPNPERTSVRIEEIASFMNADINRFKQKNENLRIEQTLNPALADPGLTIPIRPRGSDGTILGEVPANFSRAGLAQPIRVLAKQRLTEEELAKGFENVTFAGTFRGIAFVGTKFTDCRFVNCTFSRSVSLRDAEMIDCIFQNINFDAVPTTNSLKITGKLPEKLPWDNNKADHRPDPSRLERAF